MGNNLQPILTKSTGVLMSKKEEYRKRIQKQRSRNRVIVIISVSAIAVLLAALLILPGLKKNDVGTIATPSPVDFTVPVDKTSAGDPNAPVKLDVWEDFQCSGCYYYSQNIEPMVIQNYVNTGKAYYTVHLYPFIDGGQGESHDAANAAMCAAAQGKFWDFHAYAFANWLGENAGSYTPARLSAFAEAIGLDMTAYDQCFQNKTYAADIQADVDAGDAIGVPPTPGIFVNGKAVTSSAGANVIPSVQDIGDAINAAAGGN